MSALKHTVTLRVLDIIEGTSVDGPGLRTSIYLAGCQHHCQGCHNPQSWDINGGHEMSIEDIIGIVEANGFNVTLTGGDPLMQLPEVTVLATHLHSLGYKIWCYTGYTWEELLALPNISPLLSNLEVIVDGRFKNGYRDTSLLFRGSRNQRIIDVTKTLEANEIILYNPVNL